MEAMSYGSWAQWRRRLKALPSGGASYVTCSAHQVAHTCGCVPSAEHKRWTEAHGCQYDEITVEAAGKVLAGP